MEFAMWVKATPKNHAEHDRQPTDETFFLSAFRLFAGAGRSQDTIRLISSPWLFRG
jgi:hypothetical protein